MSLVALYYERKKNKKESIWARGERRDARASLPPCSSSASTLTIGRDADDDEQGTGLLARPKKRADASGRQGDLRDLAANVDRTGCVRFPINIADG